MLWVNRVILGSASDFRFTPRKRADSRAALSDALGRTAAE